jgi:hypothetical protein
VIPATSQTATRHLQGPSSTAALSKLLADARTPIRECRPWPISLSSRSQYKRPLFDAELPFEWPSEHEGERLLLAATRQRLIPASVDAMPRWSKDQSNPSTKDL